MTEDLKKRYAELREVGGEGAIPAKRIALAEMLTERRKRLVSLLHAQRYDNDPESTYDPTSEIATVTAELVLLMIERGA